MKIIHRKEPVVVPLADLVADDLPVNDGCHLVLAFHRGRVYADLGHFDLPAVLLLPVPAPVLFEVLQVAPVHGGGHALPYILFRKPCFQRGEDFLLLLLPLRQLLLHFGMQGKRDAPLAVEHFHRHLVGEICHDNPVQYLQSLLDGMLFERVGGQDAEFVILQVVNHIGGYLFGLHGQRPCLRVHDKAVRGKAFLPFLVGEIDRRGYQFLVGTCRFLTARTADHRRDDRLKVL